MSRLTANDINLGWLKSATLDDLKAAMRAGGDVLAACNSLLQTPDGKAIAFEMMNDPDYVPVAKRQPDAEEAAAIAEDEARAKQQAEEEARRNATENAADNLSTPTETKEEVVEEKKKIIVEYQVTDEKGKPIGRITHVEGWSPEEIYEKLKAAHINAVRYAERLKENRSKQAVIAADADVKNAAARAAKDEADRLAEEAANEADPEKRKEKISKIREAQVKAKDADDDAKNHGKLVAQAWMEDHKEDFLPCIASSNIMKEYMVANGLGMTYENLEKTFKAVKHQLPPVERQQATEVTTLADSENNPPAPAPVAAAPAPATITPPVAQANGTNQPTAQPPAEPPAAAATAPTPTSVAANNTPAATRRPGVNGSLQPGSMSAARPSEVAPPTPQETRSQLLRAIGKMSSVEFRKKLRDANYKAQLDAAGIKYS